MQKEWEVIEVETFELPSGYNLIIKLSKKESLDVKGVPTTVHTYSVSSGKFFFPIRLEDIETVVEVMHGFSTKERKLNI